MTELIIKEPIILTDRELAETIALATSADCYHEDPALNMDETNGWPAIGHLTGRVRLENQVYKGALVEMICPKCGETSWVGDDEFFVSYQILKQSNGTYDVRHLDV